MGSAKAAARIRTHHDYGRYGDGQPVDWAKVGRSSVRRRATGMTATEAAAALKERPAAAAH
jgi:hypothetical protein